MSDMLEKLARLMQIEDVARDLCQSRHETLQNYHRARLGHLVDGWPEPPATYEEYVGEPKCAS